SSQGLVNHSSFLKDKLGEQIMDPRISIKDDTLNPDHLAARRFDSDGVPTPEITYIDNGVLKDYAYNLRNAKKLGVDSNGRNFTGFQGEMPMFFSPHVTTGSKDLDTIISEVDDGVVITNLYHPLAEEYAVD
ncbi:MAG: metallopeptidase TldD-related protein, partial [Candidatus Kariarchaeaceae archaeon]